MTNRKPIPGIKTKSIKKVVETNYGIYYWKLSDGKPLMDDDYNFLSIESQRGDLSKMALLSAEARNLGFPDGSPCFQEGVEKLSEQEWADMVGQMLGAGS